jgi:hypothetical protein
MQQHQALPTPARAPAAGIRMTKTELLQALRRSEAKSTTLAAENDRLRHALEIERANHQFEIGRTGDLR